MTRALITDPSMPSKARAGERHTVCIGCNQGCIGHYHAGTPIACTINPWTGFERTLPRPEQAQQPQRVVDRRRRAGGMRGGGVGRAPAGTRWWCSSEPTAVGGQMRHALGAPGHAEIAAALVATLEGWLKGCDLRTGTAVDAEAVLAERPDRVVVATGAVPYVEPLAGEDLPVVQAWDVLDGLDLIGNQIVVADWGGDWTGLAVAEVLAARGHAVRLVTGAAAFGEAIHQYQRNMYLGRLDDVGVELVHHLRPVAVRPGARRVPQRRSPTARWRWTGSTRWCSTAAARPRRRCSRSSRMRGVDVVRVGDALGPRSFEEAIREGTEAGLAVGTPLAAGVAMSAAEVREVTDGLWVWRLEHPDWRPDAGWEPPVTSMCVECGGEVGRRRSAWRRRTAIRSGSGSTRGRRRWRSCSSPTTSATSTCSSGATAPGLRAAPVLARQHPRDRARGDRARQPSCPAGSSRSTTGAAATRRRSGCPISGRSSSPTR